MCERFLLLKRKPVQDTDGFYTDYSMYYDMEELKYVFVFGDSDLYKPEDGYYDYECDTLSGAIEWMVSYIYEQE